MLTSIRFVPLFAFSQSKINYYYDASGVCY